MYLKQLVPQTCFDYSVWWTVLTRERVRATAVHCWMKMGDSARYSFLPGWGQSVIMPCSYNLLKLGFLWPSLAACWQHKTTDRNSFTASLVLVLPPCDGIVGRPPSCCVTLPRGSQRWCRPALCWATPRPGVTSPAGPASCLPLLQCGPQVVLRQRKQMYVHLQTGVGRAEIQMVQDSSLGVSY